MGRSEGKALRIIPHQDLHKKNIYIVVKKESVNTSKGFCIPRERERVEKLVCAAPVTYSVPRNCEKGWWLGWAVRLG